MRKILDGNDLRKNWRSMDTPPRVGSCEKLRQGQLLMQRYKYCFDTRGEYVTQGEECKRKSILLAKKMVDHAEGCATCQRERVLDDQVFYGVF